MQDLGFQENYSKSMYQQAACRNWLSWMADVNYSGIVNDRQSNTRVHGGPERALCHVFIGTDSASAGRRTSNFSWGDWRKLDLTGLDWSRIEPGVRLKIGSEVEIEITRFTIPCNNLEPYFLNAEINRVSEKRNPGWSRVYARVLQAGRIRVGDEVSSST